MVDRIEKIRELLRSTPNDNFLRHALALEYIKIGKTAEAQGLFEEILTQSPDYVGSYYHLAKLLEQKGEREQAVSWYEKGMQAAQQAGDRHAYNELRSAYEEFLY